MVGGLHAALRSLTLKTKLLLMMLSLLLLSISTLFLLHLFNEQQLLSHVREYTEDLSTTIDIAQQQPAAEGDRQAVLDGYKKKLEKLGVKEVTIADAEDEVQASTNRENVGKKLVVTKRRGPREIVITGVLG